MARIANHSSEETKISIRQSFLELYQKENLERITIAAITQKACVNRGTFYRYYEDIYQLLGQIEKQYLEAVAEVIPVLLGGLLRQNLADVTEQIRGFYDQYHEILYLFLVRRPNYNIIQGTRRIAQRSLMEHLGFADRALTLEETCLIDYIANGQIGIMSSWLEHNQGQDISLLLQLMEQANRTGAVSTLMQRIKEDPSCHTSQSWEVSI